MNSLLLQKGAVSCSQSREPAFGSLLSRLARRRKAFRLRRKGPSWIGVALLVLVMDGVLAILAWGAVGLVLN